MAKPAKFVLKLKLRGPKVRPGAIAIPDLLPLLQAVQAAVDRQAALLRGGEPLRPGPRPRAIADECTLELTGVGKGSTVLPFRFANPRQHLAGPLSLGEAAIRGVGETLRALSTGKLNGHDPAELDSLSRMSDALDGLTSIDWIVPAKNDRKRLRATLDARTRERIRAYRREPIARTLTVEGILEMADFSPSDWRCRIRPAFGAAVTCRFTPEQAGAVAAALRKPVRAGGRAMLDPNTGRTDELALDSLTPIENSRTGGPTFFASNSLEQLAATQNVKPLGNPQALAGGWPEDEDLDSFLEEIYADRHA